MGWAGIGCWDGERRHPRIPLAGGMDIDSADEVTARKASDSEEPRVWRDSIAMNTRRSCSRR